MIKEYCPKAETCVIRLETYSRKLYHIEGLFQEAKKDFPTLNANDVGIYLYGKNTGYEGTFGIEFIVPKNAKISGYTEIGSLAESY